MRWEVGMGDGADGFHYDDNDDTALDRRPHLCLLASVISTVITLSKPQSHPVTSKVATLATDVVCVELLLSSHPSVPPPLKPSPSELSALQWREVSDRCCRPRWQAVRPLALFSCLSPANAAFEAANPPTQISGGCREWKLECSSMDPGPR